MSIRTGRIRVCLLPSSVTLLLALVLLLPPAPTVAYQCFCGERRAQNETIYPDIPIEPGEWPWHTLIYYWAGSRLDPPAKICEGALIDERFVLAAAHCLTVRGSTDGELLPADQLVVHVGVVSVQQDNERSRRFQVRNVTVEDESDLALIELQLSEPRTVPKLLPDVSLSSEEGSGGEELLPEPAPTIDRGWKPIPVCLVDALDLTSLYGTEMYILNQSQRNRLGGYEPVRLVLDEFLLCSGSTLAMKSRSINGTTVSFTIKDLNLPSNDRGTALYFKHQGTWSLLGFTVSRATRQWTPGSVCLPNDIISFDCLYPALDWVMENFADTNS
ncbi:serine protease 27-like [Anopheles moucheti]|uniref:serine protease 27-like n=1 Tax=Anopheles moucheti TaxID=186751 RepID=UPI0022F040B9|nr:serine protease 27-like [Anopheles moucheti]